MAENMKRVAIRVCGGCFCKYDVKAVIRQIEDRFADRCLFSYSYLPEMDNQYDYVLLINGCEYECAEKSTLTKNILINNTNWEQAVLIFSEQS